MPPTSSRSILSVIAAITFALFPPKALPQSAQPKPQEFDVASIKPNLTGVGGGSFNTLSPGRLDATNVSLRALVRFAFGVRDDQIAGGPAWFDTQKYDVVAKVDSLTAAGSIPFEPLVQTLLADRFRLKVHRETTQLPVFSLVVAKNGPRLVARSSTEPGLIGMIPAGQGLTGRRYSKASMPVFVGQLGRIVGRSVIDNTGLAGEYDFTLVYARDEQPNNPSYTALQEQLGLKLEPAKGPVEIVVVDSAEKPSEN